MIKALLIAPYQGLVETAKKIKIPEEIQLDMRAANLSEAVDIAHSAERQGYELIISRGGTATLIQEEVTIPVVHIDITGYDMLRVFTLIRDMQKGVALVGFPNITRGAATLCSILEQDVQIITIHSSDEVRGHLEQLRLQGYTVVIGDVITVQVAEQVGLRGILITSGKEALLDAIEEGRRLYTLFRKVKHQSAYLRDTFQTLPSAMVLLDESGAIIEHNDKFNAYGLSPNRTAPVFQQLVRRVLEGAGAQWAQLDDEVGTYDLHAFLINTAAPLVGITLDPSPTHRQKQAVKINNSPTHLPIIGESEHTRRLRERIHHYYAHTDRPVCIIGEPGTGKDTVARAIHFETFAYESPMIEVDGKRVTAAEIDRLMVDLLKIQEGTVLIKTLEALSTETQQAILSLINSKPEKVRVIALTNGTLETLVQHGTFDYDLYEIAMAYPLHLPPLRKRKEDIPAFVTYFLAEFHTENGNETLGMKQDAIDYLKAYDWSGNLTQLKQTIRELSTMTTQHYIDLQEVTTLLSKQASAHGDVPQQKELLPSIPLQGTLKEIEQQVIEKVLVEENHNQTKAAKRLGINRSTLWRKLNG